MVATLLLTAASLAAPTAVGFELAPRRDAAVDALLLADRPVEAFELAVRRLEASCSRHGASAAETLTALHQVGVTAFHAGELRLSSEILQAALEARRRRLPLGDPAIVETLLRLGTTARTAGYRPLAERCYAQVREALDGMARAPLELRSELVQAEGDLRRSRDLNAAVAGYRAALPLRRQAFGDGSFSVASNLTWLSWHLARAGQPGEAQALARDAQGVLDALGAHPYRLSATLDGILADVAVLDDRFDAAVDRYREVAVERGLQRDRLFGGLARLRCPLDGYDVLALDAIRRGDADGAWELLERGRTPTYVDFAVLGRAARRDPAIYARWHELRRRLHDTRTALGDAPRWDERTAPRLLATLRLQLGLAAVERGYLRVHRPEGPFLPALRARLAPNEAYVGWAEVFWGGEPNSVMAPQRGAGWAYVVRRDRPATWIPLWEFDTPDRYARIAAEWGAVFESLRRAAAWPSHVQADPRLLRQLRAWGKWHVDPILPQLTGVDRLIVERLLIPAALAVLPDGQFLGEKYDVVLIPSAAVYLLLGDDPRPADSSRAAVLAVSGFGEPAAHRRVEELLLADEPRRLRSSFRRDEIRVDRLPRLPDAELEARAVAAKFDRSMLLTAPTGIGARLGELAASGRLGEFPVIHLATHTLTDAMPERCALALPAHSEAPAETLVDFEDLLLWPLDAELVTLSGCETLRAAGASRDETFGFIPALLAAGARRTLSSAWPVDDRATTLLMNRFYENLTGRHADVRLGFGARAMPAARALREAQTFVRELRDPRGRRPFEHPAYWAGFSLVGLP
ncbi:MAG TPA: CHAT domain-containing tetratricopeptide repeat protein [Candidatus Polarisedimenticolaceae bacterium]|nr:CHAT domain-containing tetratricopeptide repeat protein [Candidatus Polarisedimenticolaceae bacterium]